MVRTRLSGLPWVTPLDPRVFSEVLPEHCRAPGLSVVGGYDDLLDAIRASEGDPHDLNRLVPLYGDSRLGRYDEGPRVHSVDGDGLCLLGAGGHARARVVRNA